MEPFSAQNAASPRQVCDVVKIFLRRRGTLKEAAQELGVAPQTLSSQLDGKQYLSKKIAKRFSDAYGFNPFYLQSGLGEPMQNAQAFPLPASVRITLPKETPAEELHQQPVTPRVNNAIWNAALATAREMNQIREHYLSLAESLSWLIDQLDKDSEEHGIGARMEEKLHSLVIPAL